MCCSIRGKPTGEKEPTQENTPRTPPPVVPGTFFSPLLENLQPTFSLSLPSVWQALLAQADRGTNPSFLALHALSGLQIV